MPIRFSPEQVNRYTFYKQFLTPEAKGPDPLAVVKAVGPLRATPPTTPYLSLWARMRRFSCQQLEEAMYQDRSLVRIPCMHAKLYIVPVEDLAAYYQVSKPLLSHVLESLGSLLNDAAVSWLDGQSFTVRELVQRVLEVMSTRGPCTIDELAKLLPELNARVFHDPEHPEEGYSRLGTRLIPAMCAQGLLVRARPRGGWRSDLYTYVTLSSWLPQVKLAEMPFEEALRRVVARYVAAFGPVTIGDISHWFGGLARRQIASALMALRGQLVRVQIAGSQGDYYMLKEQVAELLDGVPEGDPSVCLLPPRDSYPMAYSSSERFLPHPYQDRVFDRVGEATGTVWWDGTVIGTWSLQFKEERIAVRFFDKVDPDVLALVGEEARRLGDFLNFSELDIELGHYPEPTTSEDEGLLAILPYIDPQVQPSDGVR